MRVGLGLGLGGPQKFDGGGGGGGGSLDTLNGYFLGGDTGGVYPYQDGNLFQDAGKTTAAGTGDPIRVIAPSVGTFDFVAPSDAERATRSASAIISPDGVDDYYLGGAIDINGGVTLGFVVHTTPGNNDRIFDVNLDAQLRYNTSVGWILGTSTVVNTIPTAPYSLIVRFDGTTATGYVNGVLSNSDSFGGASGTCAFLANINGAARAEFDVAGACIIIDRDVGDAEVATISDALLDLAGVTP